tara:strand:+ start:9 stop:1580 length:1572 start_codon:yes stop_codon:yes gene_type:complete
MNYKNKYLKYKLKYNKIKNLIGGSVFETPKKNNNNYQFYPGWTPTPDRLDNLYKLGLVLKPSSPGVLRELDRLEKSSDSKKTSSDQDVIDMINYITPKRNYSSPSKTQLDEVKRTIDFDYEPPNVPQKKYEVDMLELKDLINIAIREPTHINYSNIIDKYYEISNTPDQIDSYIFDIYNDTNKHKASKDKQRKKEGKNTAGYFIRGILIELMKKNKDENKGYLEYYMLRKNNNRKLVGIDDTIDKTPITPIGKGKKTPELTWDDIEQPNLDDLLWDKDKTSIYSTPADSLLSYPDDIWTRINDVYLQNKFKLTELFNMYETSLNIFLSNFKYGLCENFDLSKDNLLSNIGFIVNIINVDSNHHWFLKLTYLGQEIDLPDGIDYDKSIFSKNGIDITLMGQASNSMERFMELQDIDSINGKIFELYTKDLGLDDFEKNILILIISCGLKLYGDESYKHELFKRLILGLPLYYGTHDNNNALEMKSFMHKLSSLSIPSFEGKLWTKKIKEEGKDKDENYYTLDFS